MGLEKVTDRTVVGDEIRSARKRLGLSQVEVAERADVSRRTVQHVESGNPSVSFSSIRAISKALQVELQPEVEVEGEDRKVSNLDSFLYWPFRMFVFVRSRLTPDPLAFCDQEADFLTALELIWENFRTAEGCNPEALGKLHPEFTSRQGYFDRYLRIWRACPRAFSFSSAKGQRTGVSIVLPVSATNYRSFLSGRRSIYDIQGAEVLPASQTLLYESLALFSNCHGRRHSLNSTLGFIAVNHLAQLFPSVLQNDCDLASFAARTDNVQRMRRSGMAPVGTKTFGIGNPIWNLSNHQGISPDENEEIRGSTSFHFISLRQKSLSIRKNLTLRAIAGLQKNRAVLNEFNKRRTA